MFCKNCGTQLSDDSKFCSNCGYKTENTNSDESTENIEIDNSQIESKSETTNPSSSNRLKELYNKISDKLFLRGFVSAAFLSIVSIINLKLKSINKLTKKDFISLTIVLLVLCVVFSTWGFIDYANEQDSESSYGDGSYSGSYNDYYSSGIDKSIGLSLKVDSIKTSGSYTYVYCTVTNVSSKYVATRYRYVKVKAQFKNYSGSIVDTDWTYAVDSTWLEPGESKSFYYMVQNTNIKSATLSFVD